MNGPAPPAGATGADAGRAGRGPAGRAPPRDRPDTCGRGAARARPAHPRRSPSSPEDDLRAASPLRSTLPQAASAAEPCPRGRRPRLGADHLDPLVRPRPGRGPAAPANGRPTARPRRAARPARPVAGQRFRRREGSRRQPRRDPGRAPSGTARRGSAGRVPATPPRRPARRSSMSRSRRDGGLDRCRVARVPRTRSGEGAGSPSARPPRLRPLAGAVPRRAARRAARTRAAGVPPGRCPGCPAPSRPRVARTRLRPAGRRRSARGQARPARRGRTGRARRPARSAGGARTASCVGCPPGGPARQSVEEAAHGTPRAELQVGAAPGRGSSPASRPRTSRMPRPASATSARTRAPRGDPLPQQGRRVDVGQDRLAAGRALRAQRGRGPPAAARPRRPGLRGSRRPACAGSTAAAVVRRPHRDSSAAAGSGLGRGDQQVRPVGLRTT